MLSRRGSAATLVDPQGPGTFRIITDSECTRPGLGIFKQSVKHLLPFFHKWKKKEKKWSIGELFFFFLREITLESFYSLVISAG